MTDEPSGAALAFERQRAAMAVEGVTAPEKSLLLVLAIMANADGTSWPSITQLAARASIGRRTAFEALDRLAERGLIDREAVPGKGARYTLTLANWCASRTGAPAALVREPHSTGAPAAPKQPRTTIRRKKTTSSPSTRAIDMPAGTSEEAWARFVEMRQAMARKSKGKPWTDGAARLAAATLAKLAAAGDDPDAVLDRSTLNGWAGLFPLQDRAKGLLGAVIADERRSRFDKPSGPLESRRLFHERNQVDDSDDDSVPF